MAAVGIVCEYNPFHLGHEKQLRLARALAGPDAAIVCLMSGNFVQRGAPAVFDKAVRAAAAVDCGANLVLELPVTRVLQSAEGFASGAVEIFDRLGCVDQLCFGCESGDGALIWQAAQAMEQDAFPSLLREQLAGGLSYAAALQQTLEQLAGGGTLLRSPNDILAVEYCRALLRRGSAIRPLAILREGGYHDRTPDAENPSATAVRHLLQTGGWEVLVPEAAVARFQNAVQYRWGSGERAVLARLRGMTDGDWQRAAHGAEGLWSKVMKASRREQSVEGILQAAKSKRYPRTRLTRLLMCAYLGISQADLQQEIPYVRVMAFDQAGRALLRRMRETGKISLVNAGEKPRNSDYFSMECRCSDLYTLFCAEKTASACGFEQNLRIYQKKN